MMTTSEIKANNLDVYTDISKLKEKSEKVKIPHPRGTVNNIVYTVASGTFDWIRDNQYILYFHNQYGSTPGCYRFTIIHHRKFDLSVGPAKHITGVNTVTYINDMISSASNQITYSIIIDITTTDELMVRDLLPWTLEFVSGVSPSKHISMYTIE